MRKLQASGAGGAGPAAALRTPLDTFERIYSSDRDPWGYASNARERRKYDRTLAALDGRRYHRGLEVGSSIGVFTRELAAVCDEVVALEPSGTALARARERLRELGNVRLVQGALPEDLPRGPFDLIVCSEVLYYLSEPALRASIPAIETELGPGGTLVAVHYAPSLSWRLLRRAGVGGRSPRPPTPLSGERVHQLLRHHTRLGLVHHERDRTYVLDRFDDR